MYDTLTKVQVSVSAARQARNLADTLDRIAQKQALELIDMWLNERAYFMNELSEGYTRGMYNEALLAARLHGSMLNALLAAFNCNVMHLATLVGSRLVLNKALKEGKFGHAINVGPKDDPYISLRAIDNERAA